MTKTYTIGNRSFYAIYRDSSAYWDDEQVKEAMDSAKPGPRGMQVTCTREIRDRIIDEAKSNLATHAQLKRSDRGR